MRSGAGLGHSVCGRLSLLLQLLVLGSGEITRKASSDRSSLLTVPEAQRVRVLGFCFVLFLLPFPESRMPVMCRQIGILLCSAYNLGL